MELEEGLLLSRDIAKKHNNCNPRHNNNINAMSIETDVWLVGEMEVKGVTKILRLQRLQKFRYLSVPSILFWTKEFN